MDVMSWVREGVRGVIVVGMIMVGYDQALGCAELVLGC